MYVAVSFDILFLLLYEMRLINAECISATHLSDQTVVRVEITVDDVHGM